MKLHPQLGISYNAARRIRHELMQVMMERDREHPLGGWVELDNAHLGGERSGGKRGRGAPGNTPFVAALETNDCLTCPSISHYQADLPVSQWLTE